MTNLPKLSSLTQIDRPAKTATPHPSVDVELRRLVQAVAAQNDQIQNARLSRFHRQNLHVFAKILDLAICSARCPDKE